MFIAALFTTAKMWKQPKCPSTEGLVKKMWCVYTMEYYSAMKKNERMPFAVTCVQLETVTVSEAIRRRKTKLHHSPYTWTLESSDDGTSFTKQRKTYRHGQLNGYQGRKRGRDKLAVWGQQTPKLLLLSHFSCAGFCGTP